MKAAITLCLLTLPFLAGCRETDTFALKPGGTMVVTNQRHRRITVRADYPVSVAGRNCSATRIVDQTLYCDAADLVITDGRPEFLIWGKANQVTVSSPEIEF